MSANLNQRHTGRSNYRRRRRSPAPVLLFLAGAAILAFFVFRAMHPAAAPVGAFETPSPSQPAQASPIPFPSSTPTPTLPPVEDVPWQLTLANEAHPLPEDWDVETQELNNGLEVDSRIYDALSRMLNDCKAEGLSPIVCSAYRTVSRQMELFEKKVNERMAEGLSYSEAYDAAAAVVAIPGTSEHNLGLAVDICAQSYQVLDDAQAETAEQQWLMEHCTEYGFILRYPKGKEDLTGIIWEPWHYRYVGVDAAREITDSGLCLEEYLALHYRGV